MKNIEDIVMEHFKNEEYQNIVDLISELGDDYKDDFTYDVFLQCCLKNNLKGLRFFCDKYSFPENNGLFSNAVYFGDLDMVKFLLPFYSKKLEVTYTWGLKRAIKADKKNIFSYIWQQKNAQELIKSYDEKFYERAYKFHMTNKIADF